MSPKSIKSNREAVKSLFDQNITNAAKISRLSGVPLRSCERYVALLKKTGKIPPIHRPGRPRKLSPKMRRHAGKILKNDHFTTQASRFMNGLCDASSRNLDMLPYCQDASHFSQRNTKKSVCNGHATTSITIGTRLYSQMKQHSRCSQIPAWHGQKTQIQFRQWSSIHLRCMCGQRQIFMGRSISISSQRILIAIYTVKS